MLVIGIELDIGYVDHRALKDRPSWQQRPGWPRRIYAMRLLKGFAGVVVMGDKMNELSVELKEPAEESVAQPHGASDDRVENRLDVGLRPADDTQNLRGCRLLLQRLGELAVA